MCVWQLLSYFLIFSLYLCFFPFVPISIPVPTLHLVISDSGGESDAVHLPAHFQLCLPAVWCWQDVDCEVIIAPHSKQQHWETETFRPHLCLPTRQMTTECLHFLRFLIEKSSICFAIQFESSSTDWATRFFFSCSWSFFHIISWLRPNITLWCQPITLLAALRNETLQVMKHPNMGH